MYSMRDRLRHRGPDALGEYSDSHAAIGHTRLSIIDLAGGKQPISLDQGRIQVILNGEIYNYQSLRQELQAKGHEFHTESDTEVIGHLYLEYGDACVSHLRGMFAFIVWDVGRERVFAARDHFGQKPFYYVEQAGELRFASEIKALLAADPSLAEMDCEALDQYLTLRIITPPKSMFRRIRKLPPAHTLVFDRKEGLAIRRYWDLSFEPKWVGNDDELLEMLIEQMIDSLSAHMVSDVPVGAFLSAGFDSTLVVAMLMKHLRQDPIPTFTIGIPYGDFDEAPGARAVAQQYSTKHYEKNMIPSLCDALPDLVWQLDEPSDPLSVCSYRIAEMASEHVKVVLGGDGGDELFAGYDRYYGNLYAERYGHLPAWLRSYLIGPLLQLIPQGRWYKSKGHQLRWLHRLSFEQGASRYAKSLSYFYFDQAAREKLYTSAFQRECQGYDAEEDLRDAYRRAPAAHPVDRMLYADAQLRLSDHSVMILDRMSMAFGLEARSPLMDHRLAEFCARLPVHMKVKGRKLRIAQQRLAKRYLPEMILSRKKQGFSSALPYLLEKEYRLLFDLYLRKPRLAEQGLLEAGAIQQLLKQHLDGKADHANRLWLLLNSEVWYRMHIEGQDRESLRAEIQRAQSQRGAS